MSIRDTFLSNEDIEPDQNQIKIVNRFEKLQKERVAGFKEYVDDVKKFQFDKPELTVSIKDDELEVFLKEIKNL